MRDFQDYLKRMVEDGEEPTGDPAAAGPVKPGVSLDQAKSPAEAFMAYQRELTGLWGNVKNILVHADTALGNIEGEIEDYLKDALPVNKVDAAVDTAYKPGRARPTIDRNAIRAMTQKAQGAATPPPAAPTT